MELTMGKNSLHIEEGARNAKIEAIDKGRRPNPAMIQHDYSEVSNK